MFEWPDENNNYIDSTEDGISHINTFSKGKTKLGRMLSNFYESKFVYEPYGTFMSVEGFWYWYLTGQKHDVLKTLSGSKAKATGKKFSSDRDEFELSENTISVMQGAIICKIAQNKEIQEALINSTLPFIHYYVMFNRVIPVNCDWFNQTMEDIRAVLKENGKL